jgi:hypothetical protein
MPKNFKVLFSVAINYSFGFLNIKVLWAFIQKNDRIKKNIDKKE